MTIESPEPIESVDPTEPTDAPEPARRRQRRPQQRPARIEGLVIKLLIRALGLLPLNIAQRLFGAAALVCYPLAKTTRAVISANLAVAFPTMDAKGREALCRRSFRHSLYLLAETGYLWHASADQCRQQIDEGAAGSQFRSLLEQAQREQRGLLVLIPHFGNWELLSLLLGRHQVTALYDPPRMTSLEQPIRASRERHGATLLPIDRRGIRGMLRALADGGLVALLPDQVPEQQGGIYAPFFGRPTLTMTLVHRLLKRSQPRVAMMALQRRQDRFELLFEELPAVELAQATPLAALTLINAATERVIEHAPEQYQWSYKRFKRPPPGVEKLY